MAMKETDMPRVVFVRGQEEAGINAVFDPALGREIFQVFIHNLLPFRSISEWEFADFTAARSFAAKTFATEWKFLSWDFKTKRPCEDGGRECGSGECDTCKSIKAEEGAKQVSAGCSTATGAGSCGHA